MKKILLTALAFLFLSPVLVSANWWCGATEYGDCPSEYPVECCVDGSIPICLYTGQACDQNCCVGGGCDSWDDYWFCNEGDIGICDVTSPYQHNMICCPSDFPQWKEQYQVCWKEWWECTRDDHCSENLQCSDNRCLCIPDWDCGTWDNCVDEIQSRTCTDGCGDTKVEKQSCEPDQCNLPSDCIDWCKTHDCATEECEEDYQCLNHKCSVCEAEEENGNGNGEEIVRPDIIDLLAIIIGVIVIIIIWLI